MSGRLAELIAGSPGRSALRLIWWHLLRTPCLIWFGLFYRFRVRGREHLPHSGPVLIVSNHQSFLDPIIVGLATGPRPMYSLARSSLYRFPIAWLIRSLNGIPVDRGQADTKAIRRCVEVLKEGGMLAIFPEGTRTTDGAVQPFKGGVTLLIKRAKPMIVPLAIEGSFAAWPRTRKLPRLCERIRAAFGEPISAEALADKSADKTLKLLHDRVAALRASLINPDGEQSSI